MGMLCCSGTAVMVRARFDSVGVLGGFGCG